MDSEIIERISRFLALQGSSMEILTPKQRTYLEKIMAAIIHREKALKSARCIIAENELNIASIAKDAGIARKTIYNNPLLRRMIIDAEKASGTAESDRTNIYSLKKRIHTQEKQIQLLIIHDIEMQELKHYNEELRKECLEKEIRIKNLEKDYLKALAENKKLRKNI